MNISEYIIQPKVIVSVYPNPFISTFTLKNDGDMPLRAEVMDMLGKAICTKTIATGEEQINLGGISDALYLLKLYDNRGQVIQTFKIQKVK